MTTCWKNIDTIRLRDTCKTIGKAINKMYFQNNTTFCKLNTTFVLV